MSREIVSSVEFINFLWAHSNCTNLFVLAVERREREIRTLCIYTFSLYTHRIASRQLSERELPLLPRLFLRRRKRWRRLPSTVEIEILASVTFNLPAVLELYVLYRYIPCYCLLASWHHGNTGSRHHRHKGWKLSTSCAKSQTGCNRATRCGGVAYSTGKELVRERNRYCFIWRALRSVRFDQTLRALNRLSFASRNHTVFLEQKSRRIVTLKITVGNSKGLLKVTGRFEDSQFGKYKKPIRECAICGS